MAEKSVELQKHETAQSVLAPLRGQRMGFELTSMLPAFPGSPEVVSDPCLMQHTRSAWNAASKLDIATSFWLTFLTAVQLHVSISDENQATFTALVPEMKDMQIVLNSSTFWA